MTEALLKQNERFAVVKTEWRQKGKAAYGSPENWDTLRYTLENGDVFNIPANEVPLLKGKLKIFGAPQLTEESQ